jgi:hypothetical protein
MKQKIENLYSKYWHSSQIIKINAFLTVKQLKFSIFKWKLISCFLIIIQLCKNLFYSEFDYVIFVDNFFIDIWLFKTLKVMNMRICETIKIESEYSEELIRIRATANKFKDWDKMRFMIVKSDKKMNIEEENVLCMTWVNLNIVQYMIIIHIIDEMKKIIYNDLKRRHEDLKFVIYIINEKSKFSFLISIVEYNHYMRNSNENAQQRFYYSCQRSNNRYWWSFFTFCWMRLFWMHLNFEIVCMFYSNSHIRNFRSKLLKYSWKMKLIANTKTLFK